MAAMLGLLAALVLAAPPAVEAGDDRPPLAAPRAGLAEADAAVAQGEASYRAGRWAEAAEAWGRAVAGGARRPGVYMALGLARLRLASYDEAAAAFTEAEHLGPPAATAPYHLGLARSLQGRHQEAADAYRLAAERSPADARILNNLGQALLQLGDAKGARAAFEAGLAQAPGQRELWFNLGLAKAQAEDAQGAEAAWRKALELSPGWELALQRLPGAPPARLAPLPGDAVLPADLAAEARRLEQAGDWRGAQATWRRALVVAPGAPEPFMRVALMLAAHGAPASALPLARKAVALAPRDAQAWLVLGGVLARCAGASEADRAYRQALSLHGGSVDARLGLAVLADLRGDRRGARAALAELPGANPRVAALQALWRWRDQPGQATRQRVQALAGAGITGEALKAALAGRGVPEAARQVLLDL